MASRDVFSVCATFLFCSVVDCKVVVLLTLVADRSDDGENATVQLGAANRARTNPGENFIVVCSVNFELAGR